MSYRHIQFQHILAVCMGLAISSFDQLTSFEARLRRAIALPSETSTMTLNIFGPVHIQCILLIESYRGCFKDNISSWAKMS